MKLQKLQKAFRKKCSYTPNCSKDNFVVGMGAYSDCKTIGIKEFNGQY
ncbi:MAG: hypothetical protein HQK54_10085 [Oligoflexales bacterium]|nr:hypothetical protein [Oligoflexales bacterium]